MLTGTNLEYTKAYNLRVVLETVRQNGPLSRAQVSRLTALTRPAVSSIVQGLVDGGLIREMGQRRGERGTPSTPLELNPEGAFAIGLDFDRDHLTGVLVDLAGRVRGRVHHELHFPPPARALALMSEVAEGLITAQGVPTDKLWGVGAGFPGPLKITKGNLVNNTVSPHQFPGWHSVPVVDLLATRLRLPVFLENNATAAAVGEHWYGAGRTIGSFFYVFFGIGLGGGLVLNGQPYEGVGGNAGEIGYFPIKEDGKMTYLGEFCKLPKLYELLRREGEEVSNPQALTKVYEKGSRTLCDWLDRVAEHLALALSAVEHLFDPEAIILGGRLPPTLLEHLLTKLTPALPSLRPETKSYGPRLLRAQAGEDAAALGLATLPLYDSLAPHPNFLLKKRLQDGGEGVMQLRR